MAVPRRRPTAVLKVSSSILRPTEVIGRACSHAPESLSLAARSLARSNSSEALSCSASATLMALLSTQHFSLAAPVGGVALWPTDHLSSAMLAKGVGRGLWDVGRIAGTKSAVAAVDLF